MNPKKLLGTNECRRRDGRNEVEQRRTIFIVNNNTTNNNANVHVCRLHNHNNNPSRATKSGPTEPTSNIADKVSFETKNNII